MQFLSSYKSLFHSAFFMLLFVLHSCTQQRPVLLPNKYGLRVVEKPDSLRLISPAGSPDAMVDLSRFLQPLHTDFVYATAHNFTHQVLYQHPKAYVRLEAATALQKVQDTLQSLGYDLKIFDAYRPYRITQKMWEIVPDDRYAANPANGSGHNRGVAVDLTLIDKKTGKELPMPTPFDNFSDTAHHDFMQLSEAVLQNRKLLKTVMEQYGFIALSTEWWHYSLPNPKRYELLNINFNKMRKVVN
jgi:D-alanyl-D-alanine dipeptidase